MTPAREFLDREDLLPKLFVDAIELTEIIRDGREISTFFPKSASNFFVIVIHV